MGKHPGAYRSEKRKKELARIAKREEKLLKRKKKGDAPAEGEAPAETINTEVNDAEVPKEEAGA